mmetsp:Transcript_17133/g.22407  ORF Transcript_17133/g.22407 Transcript_17133/m.22407 type:complete len:475 (+) Transcript_17133:259-1683(+)
MASLEDNLVKKTEADVAADEGWKNKVVFLSVASIAAGSLLVLVGFPLFIGSAGLGINSVNRTFHLSGLILFPGCAFLMLGVWKLRKRSRMELSKTVSIVLGVLFYLFMICFGILGFVGFVLMVSGGAFYNNVLCDYESPFYLKDSGGCPCDKRDLIVVDDTLNFTGTTPENFTVAFIGDIGIDYMDSAFSNIVDEGADMLIINGDLTYASDADGMEEKLNESFGSVFPVFITVGNHDTSIWTDYQRVNAERYQRVIESNVDDDIHCSGSIGVDQVCVVKGLGFVFSGIGSGCGSNDEMNANLGPHLQTFESNNVTWKHCLIHKNQRLLQTGTKEDEVGWEPYETCLEQGALMYNSHEHAYARTHQLDGFGPNEADITVAKEVPSFSPELSIDIEAGSTMMILNGLGGKSIRDGSSNTNKPWWAQLYNEDSEANPSYAVHYCKYNFAGDANKAFCYYVNSEGTVIDEYFMTRVNV